MPFCTFLTGRDGAIDDQGRFTLFARPEQEFKSPGLNCSGLVTGISRAILGRRLPLSEIQADRLGDQRTGFRPGPTLGFRLGPDP